MSIDLKGISSAFIGFALVATVGGCSNKASDGGSFALPDTLRVAALYSPSSYFIYKEEEMGYDYSLVQALGREKGMALDLTVAHSLAEAVALLDSGIVDVIAHEVPVTAEYRSHGIVYCGPRNTTRQVLVQPLSGRKPEITDVTQLVGRDVYVIDKSKYLSRMENLNDELGGGIAIHTVDRDTLIAEDLIEMVSKGEIPLTVVDSDVALVNKTYYPRLDITMPVSFAQQSAWAVSESKSWLADSIDAWITADKPRRENAALLKRYFELSKTNDFSTREKHPGPSAYDAIFKAHAGEIGWDWRLLSAVCFAESRYDPTVKSWVGAKGIMQVMPATGKAYGYMPEQLDDPEVSVAVAVKIIAALEKSLRQRVPDGDERLKFVLAAYNSGVAHIYDAITLARKAGYDPQRWFGNVEEGLLMKAHPEYYNDPDVKYGYFRGRQTTAYVGEVLRYYEELKEKVK